MYKELPDIPPEPEKEVYYAYGINSLKRSGITMRYSNRYVEVNFECKEKTGKVFHTSTHFHYLLPDGKYTMGRFTLPYLLQNVKDIPDAAKVLLHVSECTRIFGKDPKQHSLVKERVYSYNMFDLREYLNNISFPQFNTKKCNFVPHSVNYSTYTNRIGSFLGLGPKYQKIGRYNYFIDTKLKLFTHVKRVKNLDEGARMRFTEKQRRMLFSIRE